MKKTYKRSISILVTLVMVFGSFLQFGAPASATENNAGEVIIDKTATRVNGSRKYLVELEVKGEPIPVISKNDIILVLDKSGSMKNKMDGTTTNKDEERRWTILKNAANSFVDNVLDSGDNQIAVVTYSGDSTSFSPYTDSPYNDADIEIYYSKNATAIKNSYGSITPDGGTNMQAGFMKAEAVLNSSGARPDAKKYIIFMSDGEPTFYYKDNGYTTGNGSSFDSNAQAAAIAVALHIKNNYETKIYTIGITTKHNSTNIKNTLNPSGGNKYQEQFYEVSQASELEAVFTELAGSITNIAEGVVVTDYIAEGFTFDDDFGFEISTGAGSANHDAGVIEWKDFSVTDQKKTLKFQVIADDPIYGAAFTNDHKDNDKNKGAYITFTPVAGNDFYDDDNPRLAFPKPSVPVPPIALNDNYTVDAGQTLNVSVVDGVYKSNDLATDHRRQNGTATAVDDSVELVDDVKHGDLTLNADGSFTYTPEDGFAGTDTFKYKIKTTVTIKGKTVTLSDTAIVTITVNPGLITIRGTKTWDDADDQDGIRPDKITLTLYANNEKVEGKKPAWDKSDNPWLYAFEDLPTHVNGQAITYRVEEETVPLGYNKSQEGLAIKNTHIPAITSVTVRKEWDDGGNQDGLRTPSVKVQLKADGSAKGDPVTLDDSNHWEYTWNGLAKHAGSTEPIEYTVEETDVPDGYTPIITTDENGGYVITNEHTPDTITITGTKTWNDDDDQDGNRPDDIRIILYANGDEVEQDPSWTKSGNVWTYEFTDLPLNEAGEEIEYTVSEDPVSGYTTSQDGYNFTNTLDIYDLKLEKHVANDSKDEAYGDLAFLKSGETARYRVIVTNIGNKRLDHVIVTDTLATPGTDVFLNGVKHSWIDDNGVATLEVGSLDPDQSATLIYYQETDADFVGEETFTNLAEAVGEYYLDDETIDSVDAEDTATITVYELPLVVATISVTKQVQNLADGKDPADEAAGFVGDTFRYTITVENTGNVELAGVILTDDKAKIGSDARINGKAAKWADDGSGKAYLELGDLAAEAIVLVTYEYTAEAEDAKLDEVVNLALAQVVIGETANGSSVTVEDQDTAAIKVADLAGELVKLEISKLVENITAADGAPFAMAIGEVGDTFRYSIKVTNSGNVDLTDLILTDDKALVGSTVTLKAGGSKTWTAGAGGIATLQLGDLKAGASIELAYDYQATDADADASMVKNTAKVSGNADGSEPEADAFATIVIEEKEVPLAVPGLKVTKLAQNLTRSGKPADLASGYVGDKFRYTVTIENTGTADLAGVILTDNKVLVGGAVYNVTADKMEEWLSDSGKAYLVVGDLAPGEKVVYSYEYTSVVADSGKPIINVAHVSGEVPGADLNGNPVTVEHEDKATVSIDQIPKTGEAGSLPLLGYGLLLAVGVLLWIRRRFKRGTQE